MVDNIMNYDGTRKITMVFLLYLAIALIFQDYLIADDEVCDDFRGTPLFLDMPDSYMDLYLQYETSRSAQSCSAAIEKVGDGLDVLSSSWEGALHSAKRSFSAQEYIQACLTGYLKSGQNYFEERFEEAARRVAIFFSKRSGRWVPFCVGFLVEARTVVTAKHCFAGEIDAVREMLVAEYGDAPEKLSEQFIQLKKPASARLILLSNTENPLDFNIPPALYKPFDANAVTDDVIEVQVEGDQSEVSAYPVVSPQKWDKIAFPVFTPSPIAAARINYALENPNLGTNTPLPLSELLRLDISPYCYVWYEAEGCIFHNCNTVKGLSGSPILVWDKAQDSFALAAVHKRALFNPCDEPCGFKRGQAVVNMAVRYRR